MPAPQLEGGCSWCPSSRWVSRPQARDGRQWALDQSPEPWGLCAGAMGTLLVADQVAPPAPRNWRPGGQRRSHGAWAELAWSRRGAGEPAGVTPSQDWTEEREEEDPQVWRAAVTGPWVGRAQRLVGEATPAQERPELWGGARPGAGRDRRQHWPRLPSRPRAGATEDPGEAVGDRAGVIDRTREGWRWRHVGVSVATGRCRPPQEASIRTPRMVSRVTGWCPGMTAAQCWTWDCCPVHM